MMMMKIKEKKKMMMIKIKEKKRRKNERKKRKSREERRLIPNHFSLSWRFCKMWAVEILSSLAENVFVLSSYGGQGFASRAASSLCRDVILRKDWFSVSSFPVSSFIITVYDNRCYFWVLMCMIIINIIYHCTLALSIFIIHYHYYWHYSY